MLTYLVAMRSVLMFGAIARVRERLGAARVFTGVGFLASMTPEMRFQVLQAGVGFAAAFELECKER